MHQHINHLSSVCSGCNGRHRQGDSVEGARIAEYLTFRDNIFPIYPFWQFSFLASSHTPYLENKIFSQLIVGLNMLGTFLAKIGLVQKLGRSS